MASVHAKSLRKMLLSVPSGPSWLALARWASASIVEEKAITDQDYSSSLRVFVLSRQESILAQT